MSSHIIRNPTRTLFPWTNCRFVVVVIAFISITTPTTNIALLTPIVFLLIDIIIVYVYVYVLCKVRRNSKSHSVKWNVALYFDRYCMLRFLFAVFCCLLFLYELCLQCLLPFKSNGIGLSEHVGMNEAQHFRLL